MMVDEHPQRMSHHQKRLPKVILAAEELRSGAGGTTAA
jgi:hypothetical protein